MEHQPSAPRPYMTTITEPAPVTRRETVLAILFALSLSHLLNDVMQSLLPAVYPLLKENYG